MSIIWTRFVGNGWEQVPLASLRKLFSHPSLESSRFHNFQLVCLRLFLPLHLLTDPFTAPFSGRLCHFNIRSLLVAWILMKILDYFIFQSNIKAFESQTECFCVTNANWDNWKVFRNVELGRSWKFHLHLTYGIKSALLSPERQKLLNSQLNETVTRN